VEWWAVFIFGVVVVGIHFWQLGYQGYADFGATLLGGACFTLALFAPIYYFVSPTAGVAAASLFLAATATYWAATSTTMAKSCGQHSGDYYLDSDGGTAARSATAAALH
jgi:hypothetical protein